jgi:two-component system chemotaxis sensor kinase CheA
LQVLLQSVDVIREMVRSAQAKRPIVMVGATALSGELIRILAQKGAPANSAADNAASNPPAAIDAPAARASALPDEPDASEAAAPPKSAEIAVSNPPGGALEGWRIVFEPDLSLFKTCNDPMRIFDELANLGTLEVEAHTGKIPPFGELDPTQCFLSWTLLLRCAAEHARVAEVFDWVDANSKIVYEPIYGAGVSPGIPSLPAAELPQAGGQRSMTASEVPAAQPVAGKSGGESGSLRVATEKVDALINLVGELVITQSMLGRFAEKYEPQDIESLRRSLAQLTRNTRELQESVLQIRMLPIGFSFNRFPRLVHDLSRKLGKKVDLKLSGENTELDKTVLEKISDPLVHLVRNALDHGLELNAFHEGGSIVIEVKDDGAGLNKDRILAKARERGLVDADALLSDENIYNLIFVAGFSTADAVSDVSGRGVGMDVVRRNINDLGGHVQILSVPGRGSTIRIRLPLTLAILEGQMLRVGKEIYVASLVSIIETVQSKGEDLSCVAGRTELFKHRSDYLPIIRLYDLFGIEPDSRDITDGLLVVLEAEGRRVAMLVDELLAQQQVVIKSLETNFKQVPGLAGATIHGDGTVALILDVPGLVRTFLERQSMQLGRAA